MAVAGLVVAILLVAQQLPGVRSVAPTAPATKPLSIYHATTDYVTPKDRANRELHAAIDHWGLTRGDRANDAALMHEVAASLRKIAAGELDDLEAVEQRLTVLEEKMIAAARMAQTEDELLETRQALDRQLRPYRGKMTADQLTMLEKQYLERNLLERSNLPRLSLFYMR